MQSVYIQSYFPPWAGDHLPVSALCLRETRTMFILINEENKKVDAAKGVTELAETSSSMFLQQTRATIYVHSWRNLLLLAREIAWWHKAFATPTENISSVKNSLAEASSCSSDSKIYELQHIHKYYLWLWCPHQATQCRNPPASTSQSLQGGHIVVRSETTSTQLHPASAPHWLTERLGVPTDSTGMCCGHVPSTFCLHLTLLHHGTDLRMATTSPVVNSCQAGRGAAHLIPEISGQYSYFRPWCTSETQNGYLPYLAS